MRADGCMQVDWNTGACTNWAYTGVFNVPFYGSTAGHNNPGGGEFPANGQNPATTNPQNGATTPFPATAHTPGSVFAGTGQAPAPFSGNDGIWWLVIGAVALIALTAK